MKKTKGSKHTDRKSRMSRRGNVDIPLDSVKVLLDRVIPSDK